MKKKRSYHRIHSMRRRNAIKWLFSQWFENVYSIGSIQTFCHIVCIYQFTEYASHQRIHFGEHLNQWPLCLRYCNANFNHYYQLKKLGNFGLRLSPTKGLSEFRFYFPVASGFVGSTDDLFISRGEEDANEYVLSIGFVKNSIGRHSANALLGNLSVLGLTETAIQNTISSKIFICLFGTANDREDRINTCGHEQHNNYAFVTAIQFVQYHINGGKKWKNNKNMKISKFFVVFAASSERARLCSSVVNNFIISCLHIYSYIGSLLAFLSHQQ